TAWCDSPLSSTTSNAECAVYSWHRHSLCRVSSYGAVRAPHNRAVLVEIRRLRRGLRGAGVCDTAAVRQDPRSGPEAPGLPVLPEQDSSVFWRPDCGKAPSPGSARGYAHPSLPGDCSSETFPTSSRRRRNYLTSELS